MPFGVIVHPEQLMAMKARLLFILSAGIFTSCSGQRSPSAVASLYAPAPTLGIGTAVTETSKDIWTVFQDKGGNYWFGSNAYGAFRYDGSSMLHYTTRDGLPHNRILEIKEDKAGNIYLNTLTGISKFDGRSFTTLALAEPSGSIAWRLAPGDLWFKGATGGPYRYDGKILHRLKFPRHYMEDDYHKQFPGTTIDPYDIYYIYQDSKARIWFGTGAFGIYRFDGKTVSNLYEEHLTLVKGGGSFGIRSILEDSKGKFWFCNTKYRYNILDGNLDGKEGFINYAREGGIDHINDQMGEDRIYYQSIVEDERNDIWMQTYRGGIWQYDGRTLIHHVVKDAIGDVNVISMYQDKLGGIWLGTEKNGPYKFNRKAFEPFTM
jgi:ligand-binding sensor domain-containing protein